MFSLALYLPVGRYGQMALQAERYFGVTGRLSLSTYLGAYLPSFNFLVALLGGEFAVVYLLLIGMSY